MKTIVSAITKLNHGILQAEDQRQPPEAIINFDTASVVPDNKGHVVMRGPFIVTTHLSAVGPVRRPDPNDFMDNDGVLHLRVLLTRTNPDGSETVVRELYSHSLDFSENAVGPRFRPIRACGRNTLCATINFQTDDNPIILRDTGADDFFLNLQTQIAVDDGYFKTVSIMVLRLVRTLPTDSEEEEGEGESREEEEKEDTRPTVTVWDPEAADIEDLTDMPFPQN